MKLYVLPIGSACNASCPYCITRFRKMKNAILDLKTLKSTLASTKYNKIEITGGGEPSLHSEIDHIVSICSRICPTNIYTNGHYVPNNTDVQVCLSRAHHKDELNRNIMGVSYDINKYRSCRNLKLSLMLHKGGIGTLTELEEYLLWARPYATKVVVRQLFEYEGDQYQKYYKDEYVSSSLMAQALGEKHKSREIEGNYFFDIDGLEVEFEGRACACEVSNPVLGADGLLSAGWSGL